MAQAAVPELTPTEAHAVVDAGGVLLDVREAAEWNAGHAPEATWIPLGELSERADELPRDAPIVAICRSGDRSRAVAEALLRAGFDAANVEGGMRAWVVEDLAIVADDGLPGTVI
jgi:rhodanese-related sulfurtransferase